MSLHSRQPIGYRQTMPLNIQCGIIEYETVKQAAESRGYDTIADFLRDAINAYLDQPALIPRTSKNQHTGNRGKNRTIEISPSGELAAITVPMDKQLLLKFSSICHNQLSMTPEEAVRKTVWQVVIQDAQRRKNP